MITRLLPFSICFLFAIGFGLFFFSRFLPHTFSPVSSSRLRSSGEKVDTLIDIPHNKDVFASNQWYTSALRSFPSQPLYAMPLVYRITAQGLGFSYPTIKNTEKTIFAPYEEDLTVGFADDFTAREVDQIGDWHIRFALVTATQKRLSFFLAHGLPYTTLQTNGQNTVVSFNEPFALYDQNKTEIKGKTVTTDAFILLIGKKTYVVVLDSKRPVTLSKRSLVIGAAQTVLVGIVSDRKQFDAFVGIRGIDVRGTTVTPTVTDDAIVTDYHLITNSNRAPLLALYPHQYDTLTSSLETLGAYETIRGPLRLVQTDTFTTSVQKKIPPSSFSSLSPMPADLKKTLQTDVEAFIAKKQPDSKDYFLGTWLGRGTNLLLLADSFSMEKERKLLVAFLQPIFVRSLTYFSYDKKMQSLIATKPEFGNEKFNDHHFHYGYFIRTAAVLTATEPTMLPQIKEQVQAMVDDIATIDRQSKTYPYLRNFDMYEAHSWADGYGNFADGNNQESTSEAINAWYGIYLWSKVTKNTDLEQYALYIYNTEIQGAEYYWFDKTGIYKSPYAHKIASIVWGGKVDFATWFSPDVNSIYGIQLLPFTPASSYLADLPNFESYDKDFHESGGKEQEAWGDLFIMWKSFYQPKEVLKVKDRGDKFEEANSRSMFLYTLYKNAAK